MVDGIDLPSPGASTDMCEASFMPRDPRFSSAALLQLLGDPSTGHNQRLLLCCNSAGSKYQKMSQPTAGSSTNFSNNSNSFNNVWNNYTVADDRSQLLAWLSPLEPRLRHRDIQEHRIDNVGEWLMHTEEFRSWHGCHGEGEGDNGVLFCYGAPGVGKTFIR